jgi:hypothetical protein
MAGAEVAWPGNVAGEAVSCSGPLESNVLEGCCEVDGNEEGTVDDVKLSGEEKTLFVLGVGKTDGENNSTISGEDELGISVAWDDDPAGENVSCDAAGDAEVVETTAGAGGVTVLTGASVVIGVKDTGLEKILPEVGAVVIVGTTMPPGVTVDTGTALGASNNPGSVGCGFIGAVVL